MGVTRVRMAEESTAAATAAATEESATERPPEASASEGGAGGATERPPDASASEGGAGGLGKRPREPWFNAPADGAAAKLQAFEVDAKVSSIKSKLSRPKAGGSSGAERTHKTGLTRDQLLDNQARHREKMEAKGKPVPHYRKQ